MLALGCERNADPLSEDEQPLPVGTRTLGEGQNPDTKAESATSARTTPNHGGLRAPTPPAPVTPDGTELRGGSGGGAAAGAGTGTANGGGSSGGAPSGAVPTPR